MAVRQWISQIFSYGAQQGLCEHDPAAMLKRLVRRPPIRHNPPLPWQEIAPFMRKLDDWSGYFTTKTALKLVALTFVRTVEIRRATWDQFSHEDATWSIPAENMKMRWPHLVPLSRQALELLKELHAVTGDGSTAFALPPRRCSAKSPFLNLSGICTSQALDDRGRKRAELVG